MFSIDVIAVYVNWVQPSNTRDLHPAVYACRAKWVGPAGLGVPSAGPDPISPQLPLPARPRVRPCSQLATTSWVMGLGITKPHHHIQYAGCCAASADELLSTAFDTASSAASAAATHLSPCCAMVCCLKFLQAGEHGGTGICDTHRSRLFNSVAHSFHNINPTRYPELCVLDAATLSNDNTITTCSAS